MPFFDELSAAGQAAYAELTEATRAADLRRSIASLHGSFAQKQVKGRRYWYFQFRDVAGAVRQIYVGPDSEEVARLVASADRLSSPDLRPLARSALALGCATLIPKHFRIVRRLSEYGFFRAGGVLVGTHAFLLLGNVLGVSWKDGSRTQDVDFAHPGRSLEIALPANLTINTHEAIESLEMGFLPLTSFEGNVEATYVSTSDPGLRIDFLTAAHRGGADPIVVPELNVALQPLKFMELLLEHPIQATAISTDGAVLVNVPDPARYTIHKLIVASERTTSQRTKANKDLQQAASLIDYYAGDRATELRAAWDEAVSRGKGWRTRLAAGLKRVYAIAPQLRDLGIRLALR